MSIVKMIKSIAAGKKVPCHVCGEPLIIVHARNGDLVGAKCPRFTTVRHDSYPYPFPHSVPHDQTINKMVEAVAAGKKVPCDACGEPLMVMRAESGELVGVKCPRYDFEHDLYPSPLPHGETFGAMIKVVAAGRNVPCRVCGEPLIVVRVKSGQLVGVKCPHEHMYYPIYIG